MLLYQHGFTDFQMGYASAMAMLLLGVSFAVTLVIVVNSRRWVHYRRSGAMTRRGRAPRRSCAAGRRPRVRRKRFLLAVANHSVLIAAAIAFLAPFLFIMLTALMTNDQALSARLWPHPFRWRTSSTSSRRRRSGAGR